MVTTPEGKIKKLVKKVLADFQDMGSVSFGSTTAEHGRLYEFWPVPSGFGASSLDCIVCYYGKFIAIETKAPGKKPTPRQNLTIEQMRAAGGLTFVIDDQRGCDDLRAALELIRFTHARTSG